jgi:glutathione S-transferase
LGLSFALEQVSVFRDFDKFSSINPVVKAPTLITDDGVVLMESSLILEHIAEIGPRRLMPADRAHHEKALRLVGLGLAACEKSVSIVYECKLRPQERQHQPWLDRITGQLLAAYRALEKEVSPDWFTGEELMQPQITTAVAWRFTQSVAADLVPVADFPRLSVLSARAEQLPAFRECDFGTWVGPAR